MCTPQIYCNKDKFREHSTDLIYKHAQGSVMERPEPCACILVSPSSTRTGRQFNFLLSSRIEILAHVYNFFSVICSALLALEL